MNINPLGSSFALGSAGGASFMPSAIGGAAASSSSPSSSHTSELSSGLSDDAGSMNMLSQLATTLGDMAANCTASASGASAGVGAAGGSRITVPTPTSSGQQFRSYGSLQQSQQGGSSSDATMASLIGGGASDAGDNA